MGSGDVHGYLHQRGLSLLGGWLPWTVQIVVVVLILVTIGWRTRRWLLVWPPVAGFIGLLVVFGSRAYFTSAGVLSDPAPVSLWMWIAVTAAMLVIMMVGWRTSSWWRRGLSVLAVPFGLLCVGLVLNQWVGYFPTVQAAWDEFTSHPLPEQTSQSNLMSLRGRGLAMITGRIVGVTIPDTASHFAHRQEYVYLPPAWFQGPQPPPLPAVMMIGGEFNTPADWIRTGNALPVIDRYARTHGGYAPILVFADAGGTFNNDTECVNGPRGNAADHLTKEVRPYVVSHFDASADPAKWGIVGWSMGGTCAIDLALMHPDLFSTFEDIAGDIGPSAGSKQQTIQRLFGGNAAAYASFDPLTILAHHLPYTNTSGWFDDSNGIGQPSPQGRYAGPGGHRRKGGGWGGTGDQLTAAQQLCAAGIKDSIECTVKIQNGRHTWQFASQAFADALPWMNAHLQRTSQPHGKTQSAGTGGEKAALDAGAAGSRPRPT